MVGTVGIEPMTSCMSSMRSNQLSYAPATLILYHNADKISIINIAQILCISFVQYPLFTVFFRAFGEDFRYFVQVIRRVYTPHFGFIGRYKSVDACSGGY